mmetsp:Transcript_135194/g.269726  ORF Transcript_135194/g.269726 Transcript_135194/m.269726 type:complete len:225 (-) Transcript_135194:491-1165(-)
MSVGGGFAFGTVAFFFFGRCLINFASNLHHGRLLGDVWLDDVRQRVRHPVLPQVNAVLIIRIAALCACRRHVLLRRLGGTQAAWWFEGSRPAAGDCCWRFVRKRSRLHFHLSRSNFTSTAGLFLYMSHFCNGTSTASLFLCVWNFCNSTSTASLFLYMWNFCNSTSTAALLLYRRNFCNSTSWSVQGALIRKSVVPRFGSGIFICSSIGPRFGSGTFICIIIEP